jgi:hypothetical protein
LGFQPISHEINEDIKASTHLIGEHGILTEPKQYKDDLLLRDIPEFRALKRFKENSNEVRPGKQWLAHIGG